MKISTLALTLATALLTTGLASASFAQENAVPAGIEVITVTAKRLAPSVAGACVNEVKAQSRAAGRQQDTGVSPANVMESKLQFHRAVHDCIVQSATEARS